MGALVRIGLRYLTFPLLWVGLILPDEQQAIIADPEIVGWVSTALGILAPIAAEWWYAAAKKLGWST